MKGVMNAISDEGDVAGVDLLFWVGVGVCESMFMGET